MRPESSAFARCVLFSFPPFLRNVAQIVERPTAKLARHANLAKIVNPKIIDLKQLSESCEKLRATGKKLVATNGCFDLLHVGHVRYLQAARALGDLLTVGVNGDQSVRALKGSGRPMMTESDRAEILASLQSVDLVTIFPQIRATQFIIAVRPAIYVKGGDYSSETLDGEERAILKEIGTEIRLIPFENGYSTSDLVERICRTRS